MDNQTRAALEHQLGVALKLQRRHIEALNHMGRARDLLGRGIRSWEIERADLLQHLSRFEEAAEIYQALLVENPQDMHTHILLNEIYYRHRLDGRFLRSYDEALLRSPDAAQLAVAKGQLLMKLGRVEEARKTFEKALHIAPQDPAAQSGLARALDAQDEVEAAYVVHRSCLSSHPDHPDAMEEFASFMLRRGDTKRAQQTAERACELRPDSQGALAVLGLCYRVNRDAREDWLNDYDKFVQVFDLEPPAGYADMEVFNSDLVAYLDMLHGDDREYFTQTLRGGTRLYGEVFFNGHNLIDRLVPRINHALTRFAASLSARGTHPFVSRRQKGVRYNGSWSSRLGPKGFHVNHLHQQGWISSCYYVSVPDVAEDAGRQEGWIKFGEPSAEFGTFFQPRRSVQPRAGRLVLFPSYMWHGTVPFHSSETRVTVAFDALPV